MYTMRCVSTTTDYMKISTRTGENTNVVRYCKKKRVAVKFTIRRSLFPLASAVVSLCKIFNTTRVPVQLEVY